ncbi:MAG: serine/threonine-protein kinase [Planctomycetota bacterium]|nr:serine/threonine-protein kinase [Planctomycetota bacterium]
MSTTTDQAAGRIALRKGYVTREVLHRAIQFKAQYAVKQSLIDILCERGFLTTAQVQDILKTQNSGGPDSSKRVRKIPIKDVMGASARVKQSKRGGPGKNGSERRKIGEKPIPPGVDPSVIDDDGNVDIVGRTIGGCQVSKKIGQGGMGCLFLAQHQNLNRQVVIKVLPPQNATKKKNLERFLREARAAAKLEHPNIVQVLNVDKSPEGLYYIIMQYIDGKNLDEAIKARGKFPWRDATRIITESSEGLKLAHSNGIIHRDIKAENIMINEKGVAKVADFGLAKDQNTSVNITKDNAFIGTLLYMAPEIGRIKDIDGRVDIYSLGITYYYLLTGHQPFRGFKTMELLTKRAHDKIPPPEKYAPNLPNDLRRVLGKMLTTDRDARYLNMKDLLRDLHALEHGSPVKAGVPSLWGEDESINSMELDGPDASSGKALNIVVIVLLLIAIALLSVIVMLSLP